MCTILSFCVMTSTSRPGKQEHVGVPGDEKKRLDDSRERICFDTGKVQSQDRDRERLQGDGQGFRNIHTMLWLDECLDMVSFFTLVGIFCRNPDNWVPVGLFLDKKVSIASTVPP